MAAQAAEILQMLENIGEPGLKGDLASAFTPQGTGRVARSPNFVFIISHLLKGRSAFRVSELLTKERKEEIPPFSIRDYFLTHIPISLRRQNLALRAFGNMPALDEVKVLEDLVKVGTTQLADMLDADAAEGMPPEEIRRTMKLVGDLAACSVEMKIKTGRMKAPTQNLNLTARVEVENARDVLPGLDKRTAATVMRVLERVTQVNPSAVTQALDELEAEEEESDRLTVQGTAVPPSDPVSDDEDPVH